MAGGVTFNVIDAKDMATTEMYGNALAELAQKHPEIVGLTADLAKSTKIGVLEEKLPGRLYNMGIAEQNMFGVAAGMALSGLVPFVSTFATFASMRAGEQIRTDICYQNLNVKVIATHAGVSFGTAGTTHHCTEDLGIMRTMANLTVVCPADGLETVKALTAAYEHKGPVYIRINRGYDKPVYDSTDYDFELGRAITMHEGSDMTIIACGATVFRAREAAKILEKSDGIHARVLNMHTIKPLDTEAVLKAVKDTRRIITVEDHNIVGGLGSAVADVIASSGMGCAFLKLGIPDTFAPVGLQEDIMAYFGYDDNGILKAARELIGKVFEEKENWEDEV
ncbi:MAG: transketolase C-terminal domain-containing protein [Clostridia bacterium]|nr:transketolase C-terminal domain-containing protein [Clostridia bacterium]MDR3645580.1 transketolase C-terminal domain-containing protein [Clostridia bacterium]